MSPRDAWNMTMDDYTMLVSVDKKNPIEPVYDGEEQERIISKAMVKAVING